MIPDWAWVAFALSLLWMAAWIDTIRITRKANRSAAEAERTARSISEALRSADWVWPER